MVRLRSVSIPVVFFWFLTASVFSQQVDAQVKTKLTPKQAAFQKAIGKSVGFYQKEILPNVIKLNSENDDFTRRTQLLREALTLVQRGRENELQQARDRLAALPELLEMTKVVGTAIRKKDPSEIETMQAKLKTGAKENKSLSRDYWLLGQQIKEINAGVIEDMKFSYRRTQFEIELLKEALAAIDDGDAAKEAFTGELEKRNEGVRKKQAEVYKPWTKKLVKIIQANERKAKQLGERAIVLLKDGESEIETELGKFKFDPMVATYHQASLQTNSKHEKGNLSLHFDFSSQLKTVEKPVQRINDKYPVSLLQDRRVAFRVGDNCVVTLSSHAGGFANEDLLKLAPQLVDLELLEKVQANLK